MVLVVVDLEILDGMNQGHYRFFKRTLEFSEDRLDSLWVGLVEVVELPVCACFPEDFAPPKNSTCFQPFPQIAKRVNSFCSLLSNCVHSHHSFPSNSVRSVGLDVVRMHRRGGGVEVGTMNHGALNFAHNSLKGRSRAYSRIKGSCPPARRRLL